MEADLLTVVAAASGLPVSRVNWGEAPAASRGTYVVLHLISWNEGHTQQGPDGLNTTRVQVDCYAPGWVAARTIGGAVKAALDGYCGGVFRGIFADGMRLTREGGANAGEASYRASLDFIVNWRTDNG